jgi:hypothetical protein
MLVPSASHLKIVGDWKIDRAGSSRRAMASIFVDLVPILLHTGTFDTSIARKHGVAVHVQHSVGSLRCIAYRLSAPMGYGSAPRVQVD